MKRRRKGPKGPRRCCFCNRRMPPVLQVRVIGYKRSYDTCGKLDCWKEGRRRAAADLERAMARFQPEIDLG